MSIPYAARSSTEHYYVTLTRQEVKFDLPRLGDTVYTVAFGPGKMSAKNIIATTTAWADSSTQAAHDLSRRAEDLKKNEIAILVSVYDGSRQVEVTIVHGDIFGSCHCPKTVVKKLMQVFFPCPKFQKVSV